MRLLWVFSSFGGERLAEKDWLRCTDIAKEKGYDVDGYILTPSEYTVDGVVSYIFSEKDNVNFALSRLLKDIDYTEYDAMLFADVCYTKTMDAFGMMMDSLYDGSKIVHVKKKQSSFGEVIGNIFVALPNKINSMLLGTKTSSYLRNLVLVDNTILEIMCDFPNKCGFIKETHYLINADTDIIEMQDIPKAKGSVYNVWNYVFSGLELLGSIACLVLAIVLPVNFSSLLWCIVFAITLGVASVLHFSIANVDNLVKISKTKQEPKVIENTTMEKVENIEEDVVMENVLNTSIVSKSEEKPKVNKPKSGGRTSTQPKASKSSKSTKKSNTTTKSSTKANTRTSSTKTKKVAEKTNSKSVTTSTKKSTTQKNTSTAKNTNKSIKSKKNTSDNKMKQSKTKKEGDN